MSDLVLVFPQSGTYELPDDWRFVDIIVVGGGGGANINSSSTFSSGRGGGGGGGVQIFESVSVGATSTINVTIGLGGLRGVTGTPRVPPTAGNPSLVVIGGQTLVAGGGGPGQIEMTSAVDAAVSDNISGFAGGAGGGAVGALAASPLSGRSGGGGVNPGGSVTFGSDSHRSGAGGGGAKTAGGSITGAAQFGAGGDGFTLEELGWPMVGTAPDPDTLANNWNSGDTYPKDSWTRTGSVGSFILYQAQRETTGENPASQPSTAWRRYIPAVGGGGGGGHRLDDITFVAGGIGGGGAGRGDNPSIPQSGTPNTGGGAGGWGGGGFTSAPVGGSGVVFVRAATDPTITCGRVGVDQVVYDLATRAGIPASRIDVSALAAASDFPDVCMGIGRPATYRTQIEILQRYAFFDMTEQGGMISASRRDRLPDGTIGGDDLRAHAYGETPPSLATRERTEDYEIPQEVRINYSQSTAEYEPGTEGYQRRVTDAQGVLDIDLTSIAMEPDQAAAIAESTMLEAIVARETIKFSLVATEENKDLKAGDIKTLQVGTRTDTVRLVEGRYAYPGIQQWTALRHDPSVYASDAVGVGRRLPGSAIFIPGDTNFALLDAPLVREFDDVSGYFGAMGGTPTIPGLIEGWPGGDLIRTEPTGEVIIASLTRPGSAFGFAQTLLADGPYTVIGWQTLTVSSSMPLQSVTLQEALLGSNLGALQVQSGGWELIRFLDAEQDSDGSWNITGLIRGVNGTEWATGLHQIGDRFILLDGVNQVLTDTATELNLSRIHNARTLGAIPDPANEVAFAWGGVDRIPWAPCQIMIARNPNGDLRISWQRRDRVAGELLGELSLSESAEAYEVEVYDPVTDIILRTFEVSSPEALYTEAQQLEDFAEQATALSLIVYQIGELGRGYPARITLNESAFEPDEAPVGFAAVTVTLGGAFDARDSIGINLWSRRANGTQIYNALYIAEGSGKIALADYLVDLRDQVLADWPDLESATISGDTLTIVIPKPPNGFWISASTNSGRAIVWNPQKHGPARIGTRQQLTVDLIQRTSDGRYVASPNVDEVYSQACSVIPKYRFAALTYDTAKALQREFGGPGPSLLSGDTSIVRSFTAGVGALSPTPVVFTRLMDEVRDDLLADPMTSGSDEFAVRSIQYAFPSGGFSSQVRVGQPALRLDMEYNFLIENSPSILWWESIPSNVSANLEPHKLVFMSHQEPSIHAPDGFQSIHVIQYVIPTSFGGYETESAAFFLNDLQEDQRIYLKIDDEVVERVVTGADVAGATEDDLIFASFALAYLDDEVGAILGYTPDRLYFPATAGPSGALYRLEVRKDDYNVAMTVKAYFSFGAHLDTARIVDFV